MVRSCLNQLIISLHQCSCKRILSIHNIMFQNTFQQADHRNNRNFLTIYTPKYSIQFQTKYSSIPHSNRTTNHHHIIILIPQRINRYTRWSHHPTILYGKLGFPIRKDICDSLQVQTLLIFGWDSENDV